MNPRFGRLAPLAAALAAALSLVGCGDMVRSGSGTLAYTPPSGSAPTAIASSRAPAELAAAFRAAGYDEVTVVRGQTVRVRTGTAALIDCGTFVQTALGNRASFPADAPRAALIGAGRQNDLVMREVSARSTADLSRTADGYNVAETHKVTVQYRKADGRLASRESREFSTSTTFADNTSCRSAGLPSGLF